MGDSEEEREEEVGGAEEKDQPQQTPVENDEDKVKPVLFIGLFMTSLFALGVYEIAFNLEANKCGMTYMYEFPEYVNISLKADVAQKFPKYGLYAYGEGKMVEQIKAMKFSGIPVLYIPGNSGSHKQVRSMASVALRKALDESDYKVHFDYFSVDFSEEHSALYGAVLEQQTKYVREAVLKILSLYPAKSSKSPSSVVILGHSLGGLVAKGLFLDPAFSPTKVQVMINLATPNTPVLVLDHHTQLFYNQVDELWHRARNTSLKHITLVNIAGGERDIQVRSGLTGDAADDLTISTTAAASVWVSADHRCIVWCKQLVVGLNRALFDMVARMTKQISMDPNLRRSIFEYHLYQRSGGKEYEDPDKMHPSPVRFDTNGYWSDVLKRQFTFSKGNATCNHYVMIRVNADVNSRMLSLDAVRMDNDNWVFGCKETRIYKNTKICDEGENLSGLSAIIPSKGKRKTVRLNMHKLKEEFGYTHVVVHTPVNTQDTKVNIDLYDPRERQVVYTVPKWISFWRSYPVIKTTLPGAVHYNISLNGLDHPWQAYKIKTTPLQCKHPQPDAVHYGLSRFITPWANDTTQTLLGPTGANYSNTLTAKLMTARPEGDTQLPMVELFLDPACTYTVTIQASLPQIMSQMIRFYAPMLLPFMATTLILILAFQMRRFESERYCKSTLLVLMANVSPISVVLPSRLLAYVVALPVLADLLPATDLSLIQARGLDFGILPIMLMFASIGTVFLLSCILWLQVIMFGSMANKAVVAYVSRVAPHEIVAEVAVSSLTRFPTILATLLVAIAFGSCGTIALCLGSLCYFIKVFKMYQEYLEGLVKRSVGLKKEDEPALLSGVNFQFSLAQLWLMNTVLNLPTLLTWVQNMQQGGHALSSDPSLVHAVAMSLSLAVLWQNDANPKENRNGYSAVAVVLQFVGVLVATFGTLSVYRVPWALTSAFLAVSLHQLFAPKVPREEAEKEEVSADESVPVGDKTTLQPKVKTSSGSSASGSETQSGSDSEYEYKYQLKMERRKIKKEKLEVMRSASQTTDTGFGEEGIDWEVEQETAHGPVNS